mmetsp:Transcript_7276/g.14380  ORF Transcript_7276/g.14380 Transcript_7276/m.14380 type:complete len:251 (-) Transcript_7276:4896-5648(-)
MTTTTTTTMTRYNRLLLAAALTVLLLCVPSPLPTPVRAERMGMLRSTAATTGSTSNRQLSRYPRGSRASLSSSSSTGAAAATDSASAVAAAAAAALRVWPTGHHAAMHVASRLLDAAAGRRRLEVRCILCFCLSGANFRNITDHRLSVIQRRVSVIRASELGTGGRICRKWEICDWTCPSAFCCSHRTFWSWGSVARLCLRLLDRSRSSNHLFVFINICPPFHSPSLLTYRFLYLTCTMIYISSRAKHQK